MATIDDFTRTNLDRQGFTSLDTEAKARFALPLRFTPAVGTILIVVGLALRSPVWLWSMAAVALSGAILPNGMILDLLYNFGLRGLFRAPALPATPRPRQFSYLLSATLLASSGLFFHYGLPVLGFMAGGSVAVGSAVLTASLWCLGAWFYRLIFMSKEGSAVA